MDVGLNFFVIGLGVLVKSYYFVVGDVLNCEMILFEYVGVVNVIGVVVG